MPTTRLAPSPTGALHLGNARTFLINWLMARKAGWRVLMRVEDLDGPRVKAGSAEAMLEELAWLGLDWDGPVVRQSDRGPAYRAALENLIAGGHAYPCICSRKDIEQAASAPHEGDAAVYPGLCLGRFPAVGGHDTDGEGSDGFPGADPSQSTHLRSPARIVSPDKLTGRTAAWRVRVDGQPITVHDKFAGEAAFDLTKTCGDFVVFKNDGLAAYQLAVVIDDAESGVDAIVRGDDLLESAARQIHLRRLLGLSPEPRYWHLPLVIGPDGRRLAKRHGDTRLAHYRAAGATPERILGLLGYWSGLVEARRDSGLTELLAAFDIARVPKARVVFSVDDDAFLTGGA